MFIQYYSEGQRLLVEMRMIKTQKIFSLSLMVRVIRHRTPIDETGLAESTGVEGKIQPSHHSTIQRANAKTVSFIFREV